MTGLHGTILILVAYFYVDSLREHYDYVNPFLLPLKSQIFIQSVVVNRLAWLTN